MRVPAPNTGPVNCSKSVAEWRVQRQREHRDDGEERSTSSGTVMTGDDSCACSAAWVRGFPTKVRKNRRDM